MSSSQSRGPRRTKKDGRFIGKLNASQRNSTMSPVSRRETRADEGVMSSERVKFTKNTHKFATSGVSADYQGSTDKTKLATDKKGKKAKGETIDNKIYYSLHRNYGYPLELGQDGKPSTPYMPRTIMRNGKKQPLWFISDKDRKFRLLIVRHLNFYLEIPGYDEGTAHLMDELLKKHRGAIFSYLEDPIPGEKNQIMHEGSVVNVRELVVPGQIEYHVDVLNGESNNNGYEYPIDGTIVRIFKYNGEVFCATNSYVNPLYCSHIMCPNYVEIFKQLTPEYAKRSMFGNLDTYSQIFVIKLVHPATGQNSSIECKKFAQFIGVEKMNIKEDIESPTNFKPLNGGVAEVDLPYVLGSGVLGEIVKLKGMPRKLVACLKELHSVQFIAEYFYMILDRLAGQNIDRYILNESYDPQDQVIYDQLQNYKMWTDIIKKHQVFDLLETHRGVFLSNYLVSTNTTGGHVSIKKEIVASYLKNALIRGPKQNTFAVMFDLIINTVRGVAGREDKDIRYTPLPNGKYGLFTDIPYFSFQHGKPIYMFSISSPIHEQNGQKYAGYSNIFSYYIEMIKAINNHTRYGAISTYCDVFKTAVENLHGNFIHIAATGKLYDHKSLSYPRPELYETITKETKDGEKIVYSMPYENYFEARNVLDQENSRDKSLLIPEVNGGDGTMTLASEEMYLGYRKSGKHQGTPDFPRDEVAQFPEKYINVSKSDMYELARAYVEFLTKIRALADDDKTIGPVVEGVEYVPLPGEPLTEASSIIHFMHSLIPDNSKSGYDAMTREEVNLIVTMRSILGFYIGIALI